MSLKRNIHKFGFRFLVVVVVFFFIKLTIDAEDYVEQLFSKGSIFYFITALIFFLSTWEINDWLIKNHLEQKGFKAMHWKPGLRILGKTMLVMLPVFALVYYLGIYHFDYLLKISSKNQALRFRSDFIRASLLALTTIVFNLLYFAGKVRKEIEVKLGEVERELLDAKYNSLKSQISPHFLFNSLNTLTALMYEDRDLASDFVTRLSSCYRYILDNREADLVRLDKELQFLDSFIFMMDVRHKMSVQITTRVNVEPKGYVIPTLSLQMLVENALKHNYYSEEQPLIIVITVNETYIVIENTLRLRDKVEPSTELGINNIKKRYSHYSKQEVKVSSLENIFRVHLPLLKKDVKKEIVLHVV